MKFQYSAVAGLFDSRGKIVKRPVLALEIKDQEGNVTEVPAVIDSGADTTTLHVEYAKFLGVKLSSRREIMGIGKGRVPVHTGTFPFKIKHMGIAIEVPAWYVESENVNILLGQEVFFEHFRIKFEKDHDAFEVVEVKKK